MGDNRKRKVIEVRDFKDKEGRKIKRRFEGGIEENTLVEPSDWYIENVLEPTQEMQRKHKEQVENNIKIQKKLKEIAEKELEKEGKL